jgi:type I restriction enzyme S subunit
MYEYLKYFFSSSKWHEYIYSIGNYGVRFDRINILDDDFFNMPIPIPPLSEQKRIVEILLHCDKVIELKEKLLAEKRRQKKWLLEKLLDPNSGVRLPGFKGEWEEKTLGELGSFSKGFGISNADCEIGDVPCIKYGDIYMSYNYFIDKVVSFTEYNIAKVSKKVNYGALLFTGSGEDPLEIGKCVAYLGKEELAVGGDIIIMIPENVNPLFLAYQQYNSNMISRKAELSQGYSVVHIYADQIKSLTAKIPPTRTEQDQIAKILFSADNEIDVVSGELEEWLIVKRALMQVLLMGIARG